MADINITSSGPFLSLSPNTSINLATQETAAIQAQPQSDVLILPPTSPGTPEELAAGRFVNVDGVGLCYKDETRNKILSVERATFAAGKEGYAQSLWLRSESVKGNMNAATLPRNATLISAGVSFSEAPPAQSEIKIFKNNEPSPVAVLTVEANEAKASALDLNTDFATGDKIKIFVSSAEAVRDPLVFLSVAWRA